MSSVRRSVLALNAMGAAAAAGFAVRGVLRPEYVQPNRSADPLASFWAASSAVRTAAVAVPLLVSLARGDRSTPTLLAIAGAVQLGDSLLGIQRRNPGMALAPAVMGALHLATARRLAG